jgi:hypothetical protein
MFGHKKEEITAEWRKLLHNLYASLSIVMVIKSRRMRCAGHVAYLERQEKYKILVGKWQRKRPLGDLE